MLSESKIINFLQQNFPIPSGIGDDAAVLPLSETENYIVTTDLLIEDIHFRRQYFDAESLAYKALHANLSDLAAMGVKGSYIFLSISIPKQVENYINDFLQNFIKACKECNVILMGGDTTASPDKLFISVMAIGQGPKDNVKFRHTAHVGDIICTTGKLGYAYIGFQAFEKNMSDLASFKISFLKPTAYIQEGAWFGSQPAVHAMMDISDGLYIDLKRLCEASNIASTIDLDQLNIAKEFTKACHKLQLDPIQTCLTGGEDYGLLLAIDPKHYQDLAADFSNTFGYSLQKVGQMTNGPKGDVTPIQNGKVIELELQPFSHFGEAVN